MANIIRVGTSAGGARAKAVISWNPNTNEVRGERFGNAPGFEHCLLKFDGVGPDMELGAGKDYGRIEYAYAKRSVAAGIEMTECRLLEENGRAHSMTKRFDREEVGVETVKHHMQSLCEWQANSCLINCGETHTSGTPELTPDGAREKPFILPGGASDESRRIVVLPFIAFDELGLVSQTKIPCLLV